MRRRSFLAALLAVPLAPLVKRLRSTVVPQTVSVDLANEIFLYSPSSASPLVSFTKRHREPVRTYVFDMHHVTEIRRSDPRLPAHYLR